MTGTSSGSGDEGGSVDRRWFEEALRSQGFVVRPPDAEIQPVVADAATDEPGPQTPGAPVPTPDSDERPPVPSALLARIATRGQGPAAIASPEPDASTPPWEIAVPAVVAPWSPMPEPRQVEPVDVEPLPAVPVAAVPIAAVPIAAVPIAAVPVAAVPIAAVPVAAEPVGTEPRPAAAAPQEPTSLLVEAPTETAGAGARMTAEDTAARLESADAAAPTDAAPTSIETTPAATGSGRSAGPDADEGGLWALVGAAEPAAVGTSPRSEALRLVLTILVAIVILVIVVGSLVLASQLL